MGYTFWLRACTQADCTDSDPVTYSTAQLPPTYVTPPRLTVLGNSRIQASWDHPDQLNGILERYLLYATYNSEVLGEAMYNSTDLFLTYVMSELLAGTTYYVTLGVSGH